MACAAPVTLRSLFVRRGARALLAVGLAFAAQAAWADEVKVPAPAPPPSPPAAAPVACSTWDVEYTLAANVQLSDTTFGAGDGVHKIGPGRMILRVETPSPTGETDRLTGRVRMLFYDMRDGFTVVAKALFWGTTVKNDTHTTATPDRAGTIAQGTLGERTLTWTTPVNGMRTDGSLFCQGSLCGKFGAPVDGASEVHTTPHPVTFSPFEFDAEKRTFTMAYAVVSRSESPSQTSRITFAGREAHRACVR